MGNSQSCKRVRDRGRGGRPMCCHFFVIARESVTVGEGEGDASLIGNRCTLNCPHILENSWAIRKALGESEAESKTVCDTLSFHA